VRNCLSWLFTCSLQATSRAKLTARFDKGLDQISTTGLIYRCGRKERDGASWLHVATLSNSASSPRVAGHQKKLVLRRKLLAEPCQYRARAVPLPARAAAAVQHDGQREGCVVVREGVDRLLTAVIQDAEFAPRQSSYRAVMRLQHRDIDKYQRTPARNIPGPAPARPRASIRESVVRGNPPYKPDRYS
jgi:hypothetical protein